MTRRAFVRWLLGIVAVLAAGLTGWWKLFRTDDSEERQMTGIPEEPNLSKSGQQVSSEPVSDPNAPLFSYMILSDLHISLDDPNTIKHLKEALDDIKHFESKVETIVITGDITEYGREKDYKEFRKVLSAYKLPPIYANMGNHDYYDVWIDKNGAFNRETFPNGKTDAQSRERFQQFFGLDKPYSEAYVNGYQILLLSQEAYQQERPEVGEGAWYSDEQLNWLKQRLAQNKTGKPVFVMIHQPLPPVGSDGRSHQLIPANKFREILKPYPNVFVFCGHRHQDFQNGSPHYQKETFHLFHNSSVGRVLNRNYQNAAKEKAQGLYVQVYQDRVVLRGREFPKRQWLDEANWTIPLEKA
jgi:3',5'-cyclic AMP phosphodiesterase CpdA